MFHVMEDNYLVTSTPILGFSVCGKLTSIMTGPFHVWVYLFLLFNLSLIDMLMTLNNYTDNTKIIMSANIY